MNRIIIVILSMGVILSCKAGNSSVSVNSSRKEVKKSIEYKYLKVDAYLEKLQTILPAENDNGTIWLSAHREEDTVVYTFQEKKRSKGDFDMKKQKKLTIEKIRSNPKNLEDFMKFKFVHIFPDGNKTVINIQPKEYLKQEGSKYS